MTWNKLVAFCSSSVQIAISSRFIEVERLAPVTNKAESTIKNISQRRNLAWSFKTIKCCPALMIAFVVRDLWLFTVKKNNALLRFLFENYKLVFSKRHTMKVSYIKQNSRWCSSLRLVNQLLNCFDVCKFMISKYKMTWIKSEVSHE